jgi:predicted  nucleic acid-binding Zn-ribbon protein
MSQPFKLYRLQQIDSQLDWIHTRQQVVEASLKEDLYLRQAIQKTEETDNMLQEAHKILREAEDNVRMQRVKIEQNEATLYSGKVQNPKELQDIQSEVAALKRYLGVLEDRQLEAMLADEEAASTHHSASIELEKAHAQFAQQSNELNEEQNKLGKDITRFELERQATLNTIPAEDIALYNQLRKQRRGIAVAKVTDRACSACGTTLNSALLDAAHNPNQITRCDGCGRILYIG